MGSSAALAEQTQVEPAPSAVDQSALAQENEQLKKLLDQYEKQIKDMESVVDSV